MMWQRYKNNLRNSLLLEDFFQSWSNLTLIFFFNRLKPRSKVLNIYTCINAYADKFLTEFG